MAYQISVWTTTEPPRLVETRETTNWQRAAEFVSSRIEGGMLCMIDHSDFAGQHSGPKAVSHG